MDNVTHLPPRPDMTLYRMPQVRGVNTQITEHTTVDLSTWLRKRGDKPIDYEDIAEMEAHNAEMWQSTARHYANELAKARHQLDDANRAIKKWKGVAAEWCLKCREYEDSEITLGKVLGGLVNIFKRGK